MLPLRIAHRGASGSAPENTLVAVDRALQMNVDLIEIDIHASADGQLIVLHDETVDRTTDGSGRLRDMTTEQIRALDAGSRFDPKFAGEKIPLLDEVLERIRGKALLLIEVKESGLEESLLDLLHSTDSLNHVVAQSFDPAIVQTLRKLEPRLPCGLLLGQIPPGPDAALALSEAALTCGASMVGLSGKLLEPGLAASLKRRGLSVWTWTLNEPDHIRLAIEYGVDGIISDHPERIPQ